MATRVEPRDSLDYFPTPPWATRALCEHVIDIRGCSVWEPACGEGHMVGPLKQYAESVAASDVHDYGFGAVHDFLWHGAHPEYDWIRQPAWLGTRLSWIPPCRKKLERPGDYEDPGL
jgi:hypothetical protein